MGRRLGYPSGTEPSQIRSGFLFTSYDLREECSNKQWAEAKVVGFFGWWVFLRGGVFLHLGDTKCM